MIKNSDSINSGVLENLMTSLNATVKSVLEEQLKKEDEIFEVSLRTNATPPIKGTITKGKLKWRGISLIHQQTVAGFEKWVSQRGVRISPKIVFNTFSLISKQNS